MKNRITASIFALLLSTFGVHHFYLGKIGSGVLDILFCWTGIPQLIGFVQGIIWLTMTDEEFNKKFNNI